MTKRQGLWAEIQQERARRERARQRESREFQRAQAQMVREAANPLCQTGVRHEIPVNI